jgi:hypothetical protein
MLEYARVCYSMLEYTRVCSSRCCLNFRRHIVRGVTGVLQGCYRGVTSMLSYVVLCNSLSTLPAPHSTGCYVMFSYVVLCNSLSTLQAPHSKGYYVMLSYVVLCNSLSTLQGPHSKGSRSDPEGLM